MRFTLSVSWEEAGEVHGLQHEGCILSKVLDRMTGKLRFQWALPRVLQGRQYSTTTPATYDRVLKSLEPYFQYVGDQIEEPPNAADLGAPVSVSV